MIMVMLRIQVSSDHDLILPFQKLLCQFLSNKMGQFRRYFPFRKTLYQMVSLYPFFFMETLFCLYHVHIGILTGTPNGIFKNGLFRLFPV